MLHTYTADVRYKTTRTGVITAITPLLRIETFVKKPAVKQSKKLYIFLDKTREHTVSEKTLNIGILGIKER